MKPDSAEAYVGLISASSRLGEQAEVESYRARFEQLQASQDRAARKVAKETLKDEHVVPQCSAEILTTAGKVHFDHGDPGFAKHYLTRAAELDRSHIDCRQALARLYDQTGSLEAAARVVEELRELEPRNPTHRRSLGILQARMKRFEAAEETFREICALFPNDAGSYACLAELYLQAGKPAAEAKDFAEMAIRLEPSARHYFVLAAVLGEGGDTASAKAALKRALDLDPTNAHYREVYESMASGP
jgi:Flp pilus assembly protein TadD